MKLPCGVTRVSENLFRICENGREIILPAFRYIGEDNHYLGHTYKNERGVTFTKEGFGIKGECGTVWEAVLSLVEIDRYPLRYK